MYAIRPISVLDRVASSYRLKYNLKTRFPINFFSIFSPIFALVIDFSFIFKMVKIDEFAVERVRLLIKTLSSTLTDMVVDG